MKISAWEKAMMIFTAAFVLLTIGHFLAQRFEEPYRVSEHIMWTKELSPYVETTQTPAAQSSTQIERININTADVNQLQLLPGIGPYRAEQIVAEREANGPFRFPEDLTRVSGIGEATLNKLMDYITVG